MLPDFVVPKRRLRADLNRFIREQLQARSLRKLVTNKRIFEGHRMEASVRNAEVDRDATTFKQFEYKGNIDTAELIEDGVSVVLLSTMDFIESIAADHDKFILEDVAKICEEQNPEAEKLTFETFLKLIERFPLKFDAQGKPSLQLVIPPIPSLNEEVLSWNKNPEYLKRYNQLLRKKHDEWLNEECLRRIVD